MSLSKAKHIACYKKLPTWLEKIRIEVIVEIHKDINYETMVVKADGCLNLTFRAKECRNHINKFKNE